MTAQQSRPDLVRIGAARRAFDDKDILSAEDAHLFGLGMSQTERDALSRRILAAQSHTWQPMLEQLARRFLQQSLAEALPGTWLKRAEGLEQIHTPWADDAAVACRRHAFILATVGLPPDVLADVDDFLGVV